MKRQQRHMNNRRAKGLCEYGGCPNVSGEARRCPEHARKHAEAMRRVRSGAQCACGAKSEDGACSYYKSGVHVLQVAA